MKNPAEFVPRDKQQLDEDFVRLLNQHKKQLYRLLLCIVRNPSDADDLFQQTAVTLWDKFPEFKLGTNFSAWASTIARYKARDFIKAKPGHLVCLSHEVIELLAVQELDAEQEDCRARALSDCQRKLRASDQKVLHEYYSGGETVAQLAERMGTSTGNVYWRLWRIRRTLYACIEKTMAREGYA